MVLATTTVNLTHLLQDLKEGDLVTWGIVAAVLFFTLLHAWQNLRGKATQEPQS